jgi:hypothetical protein
MVAIMGELLVSLIEISNERRQEDKINKTTRPRKLHTKLYYQLLQKAGKQYTKYTLKDATLPDYWKEAGGKNKSADRKKGSGKLVEYFMLCFLFRAIFF